MSPVHSLHATCLWTVRAMRILDLQCRTECHHLRPAFPAARRRRPIEGMEASMALGYGTSFPPSPPFSNLTVTFVSVSFRTCIACTGVQPTSQLVSAASSVIVSTRATGVSNAASGRSLSARSCSYRLPRQGAASNGGVGGREDDLSVSLLKSLAQRHRRSQPPPDAGGPDDDDLPPISAPNLVHAFFLWFAQDLNHPLRSNTIKDIESKLKRIEDDPEGAGTTYLHHSINNINSVANRAFEPLFERQVQTEKIRSMQGMLQRFRMLFNLPSAIRKSISKGEFDLAVRE